MRLSRTITQQSSDVPRPSYPWQKTPLELAAQSKRNFLTAATLIAKYHDRLPLDIKTADFINWLLNRNTRKRGDARVDAAYGQWASRYKMKRRQSPDRNNLWWTRTDDGQALAKRDPVAFAEHFLHYSNVIDNGRERYMDANGRTWRLITDLALLKLGRAPVMYPSLAEYAHATPRRPRAAQKKLPREEIQQVFRQWAAEGQAILDDIPQ